MKSYISVEETYGECIKCEVENCDISERQDDEIIVDCYITFVDRALFLEKRFYPVSGDIYSAIHNGDVVTEICSIETAEKQRKVRLLMDLMNE